VTAEWLKKRRQGESGGDEREEESEN